MRDMRELINLCENNHEIDMEGDVYTDPDKVAEFIKQNPTATMSCNTIRRLVWIRPSLISLFDLDKLPFETTEVLVDENYQHIKLVHDKERIHRLLMRHPYCIRELPDATEEQQLTAMDALKNVFFDIKNPTENVCLKAIKTIGVNEFGTSALNHQNFKYTTKTVEAAIKIEAYNTVKRFSSLPENLCRLAYDCDPACYKLIQKMPGYDGFLDKDYSTRLKKFNKIYRLPVVGNTRSIKDYNQDQLKLVRWFEKNDKREISVKELKQQPWGNTPYFSNLVKKVGGRNIKISDLDANPSSSILETTKQLLSKSSLMVTTWLGVQRLFENKPNKMAVFYMLGKDLREFVHDEGALKKILQVTLHGGHPTANKPNWSPASSFIILDPQLNDSKITVGWVRFTVFGKDIWIDEVQTDFGKLLPPDDFAKIKDLSDGILLEFIKKMRRRGVEKFYLPTYDTKKEKYEISPPTSIYQELPRKMRFQKGKIENLDPKVDGMEAWILESKKYD